MARDFRREIVDATKAGDLQSLANIAHVLLGHVEADDERRQRQAEKKRKQRENRSVPGQVGTSGMSPFVPGRPGTNGDVPTVVHAQRSIPTAHTPAPAAQVIAKLGDVKLQASLDRLQGLMGDQWEDVAAFLLRRKYQTWQAWVDEMAKLVGMGSQFIPADLARVCADDGTLEKPIGSAYALRQFLGFARQERTQVSRSPPATAARSGSTSRRDTKPVGIPAPPSDPDVAPKWQT